MIINANSLHIPLRDNSVQMCVTSPPYWNLRDYGTAKWIGGDAECDHVFGGQVNQTKDKGTRRDGVYSTGVRPGVDASKCWKCGAVREDSQLGLEPVPDCLGWATGHPCGVCYVCHSVQWAREVKRVLRPDGIFMLNLGDSYAGSGKGPTGENGIGNQGKRQGFDSPKVVIPNRLKSKDLIGIPWRVALALQADGWYLRGDYVWAKKNCMPESVDDRCTRSHEFIFHFSKSESYYWDAEAIKEISVTNDTRRPYGSQGAWELDGRPADQKHGGEQRRPPASATFKREGSKRETPIINQGYGDHRPDREDTFPTGYRNKRDVWFIAVQPTKEAHFATFPEEIPETCILAGSSQKGCCPKCGAPYQRLHEEISRPDRTIQEVSSNRVGVIPGRDTPTRMNSKLMESIIKETIDWDPGCECNAGDPVPCIVLDCFNGSGTTGKVAARLGRRYVGIELNMKYIDISKRRVVTDVDMFGGGYG